MKRSLEIKIYIGVPLVRNAMPPPLPTPAPTGGMCTRPPVCLRAARTHCIVQRHRHRTQAQEHVAQAARRRRRKRRRPTNASQLSVAYLCYHYAVVMALFDAITLCFKQKNLLFIILIIYRHSIINALLSFA